MRIFVNGAQTAYPINAYMLGPLRVILPQNVADTYNHMMAMHRIARGYYAALHDGFEWNEFCTLDLPEFTEKQMSEFKLAGKAIEEAAEQYDMVFKNRYPPRVHPQERFLTLYVEDYRL
jgi:hypothetical protein